MSVDFSAARHEIKMLIYELIKEAKILRASYLNLWRMENNQRIIKGKHLPRITEKSGSVYIEWISYNNRNRSVHVSFDKRTKIHGDYIKKNKTNGYTKTSFKYAPEWELGLILEFEEKFKRIRKTLETLKKAEMYINMSEKRNNAELEGEGE
jgi:hypothetical protein